MKNLNFLKGVGVALVTPFDEEYNIDWKSLEKLVKHVSGEISLAENLIEIEKKISDGESSKAIPSYLVVGGTTAETPTLSIKEKQEILRFIKKITNLPIVYGIGGYDTKKILEELKTTDLSGVDAILSVTPYYNKPTQNGLIKHYSMIAEASPLPIIIYNVPGRTSCNILPKTVINLATKYSNIVGIKEASGDINQIMEIIRESPPNFFVISGDDNITLPLIAVGAVGVISVIANAFPQEWSTMVTYALNGNFYKAKSIHYKLLALCKLLFVEGNPSGIKALLSELDIIKNILRPPLVSVSSQTQDLIKKELQLLRKQKSEKV